MAYKKLVRADTHSVAHHAVRGDGAYFNQEERIS